MAPVAQQEREAISMRTKEAQIVAFPMLGLHASLGQNVFLALFFTVVSIGRSFLPRRLFEALR